MRSWRDASESRSELRDCERANPGDPEACADLREAHHLRYDEYERQARGDWGCVDPKEPCTPWR